MSDTEDEIKNVREGEVVDYTPDIETCRRLRDAGFPQSGGLFYWGKTQAEGWFGDPLDLWHTSVGRMGLHDVLIARAPTFHEIFVRLPKTKESPEGSLHKRELFVIWSIDDGAYRAGYLWGEVEQDITVNKIPVQAVAELWLKEYE